MDDAERDDYRQQIDDLERDRRKWKRVAIVALTCLVLLFGGGTLLVTAVVYRMRLETMRAMQAEMAARDRAEMAAQMAEQARTEAERAAKSEK
jgi:hypothetical protein